MTNQRSFADNLRLYAELVVRVGLNLQPEQMLALTARGVGPEMMTLVRHITAAAYSAGAHYVDAIQIDESLDRIRLEHASSASLDHVPTWRSARIMDIVANGGATLGIVAPDPELLAGQDPERVAVMSQARSRAGQSYAAALSRGQMNWLGINMPNPTWAAMVYPDLPADQQLMRLWEALFQMLRLDQPDPVAAWQEHVAGLNARCALLNDKKYRALRFTGPGTDLTVGLSPQHLWSGGSTTTTRGITFTPNLPTEEVFTLPDRLATEGTVRASKPLSLRGVVVEDFSFTFRQGEVVEVSAGRGEETLRRLIGTDAGARRLGEVALVPASNPIARQDKLFYSTLLDENAASHLALGRAYQTSAQGGAEMSPEAFTAVGGNLSAVHVDFMIGSAEMDVDGILPDGGSEPVMRAGEWVVEA